MSEPKLISPMLDNFVMGEPISEHHGVRCCPAIETDSDKKYIVKIISTPASQTQLDALLLSGAYRDKETALSYFKSLADGITQEAEVLKKLSQLEGFLPFEVHQIVPMESECGYDVYLLSTYRKTLKHQFRRNAMTHLGALNLALDLCAALTISRNSGYLYVDLKPNNIYMTDAQGYRIGDLGFLKIDTLKYTSLPDRYRSQYTAPEITDAYSALNTTLDVYALGLILYQAFNDGNLPFNGETAPAEEFPAPAYADYEMAEIILKACAPEPAMRWQNPTEMGQALIRYMQRNGAHDTPIAPVSAPNPEIGSAEHQQNGNDPANTNLPVNEDTVQEQSEELDNNRGDPQLSDSQEETPAEITEAHIYTEDEDGNLTFIDTEASDETAPEENDADIGYEDVSVEVSDMLVQADELIAHQAPEPIVQPDPIDVPIPPPLTIADEQEASEDIPEDDETSAEPLSEVESTEQMDVDPDATAPKKGTASIRWVRNVLIVLLALALLAVGIYYYKNYYLQPIDAIFLEEGEEGVLTVSITSQIDESKLTVICSDTYGNQLLSPVENGKATFTGLAPNAAYTIKVVATGFHRLTGDTFAPYTTPIQTNIVQFSAITGSEEGSVILGFAIDGPDADQWKISYTADGGENKEVVFVGHTVTVTELTVGNQYTFSLAPADDLHITGTNEVTHTASQIIKPTNLMITGCTNNTLTAVWSAAEGVSVESWTVRCYSDAGFDETIVTAETSASFKIPDQTANYTVEVSAAGMSVSERAYAAADSITVSNFTADKTDPNTLVLSWNATDQAPQDGFILLCAINDSAAQELSCQSASSATVTPIIPGCNYTFTLQSTDGTGVLGGILNYHAPDPQPFKGYGVNAELMEFMMCRTPSYAGWNRYDLSDSDYTTTFTVGEDASFLVRMRHEYNISDDTIVALFVIRDETGAIVKVSSSTDIWTDMWYRNYCELDIPSIPQIPGEYSVSVYFNAALAAEVDFSVVNK